MKEFKGTIGIAEVVEHNWSDTSLRVGNQVVATHAIYDEATEENQEELEDIMSANFELMKDAFNVRQQISFDLPELLRQRNEMLEMLKSCLAFVDQIKEFDITNWTEEKKLKELIKQATEV